ncbi:MAG: hypothetical protein SF123_07720 [Chloroflexota bacterium]|nr:hypothetical protein [Chloroflexota bacterium]
MKHLKLALALLALALLAVLAPATLAQDITYGLSQEDFALYTAALENSQSAGSFAFEYSGELNATGDDGNLLATYSGEGTFSEEGFAVTIAGEFEADGDGGDYETELRFVDETAYFNFGGMWISANQEDVEQVGEQAGGLLPVNPADAAASVTGGDMMEMMSALENVDPESFVSIVRSDDGLAVFTTTIDLGAAVADPGIQELILTALAQSNEGETMSEAEIAEMQEQLPIMLENSTITFAHAINVETNLVEGFSLEVVLDIDPAAIGQEGSATNMILTVDVGINGYDESFPVEVPADATPLSEFLGMMMGGMGN